MATVALARPAALDGFAVPLRGGREGIGGNPKPKSGGIVECLFGAQTTVERDFPMGNEPLNRLDFPQENE